MDSKIVLLAPGTFNKDEIAFVPPPLDTYVSLKGESWILLTMSRYLFNLYKVS